MKLDNFTYLFESVDSFAVPRIKTRTLQAQPCTIGYTVLAGYGRIVKISVQYIPSIYVIII